MVSRITIDLSQAQLEIILVNVSSGLNLHKVILPKMSFLKIHKSKNEAHEVVTAVGKVLMLKFRPNPKINQSEVLATTSKRQ